MTEDPAPYGTPSVPDTVPHTPLSRVFAAAGCRTQVELAAFLGVKQSTISDAKKRGSIPAEWLLTLLRVKGVNPDWVLTGQGPQYLRPCTEDAQYLRPCDTSKAYTWVQQRHTPHTAPHGTVSARFVDMVRRALMVIGKGCG